MWFTIEELSDYLKISKDTIYKLAKARKIPSSKIGNQWRFNRETVDEWLSSQSSSQPVPEQHPDQDQQGIK